MSHFVTHVEYVFFYIQLHIEKIKRITDTIITIGKISFYKRASGPGATICTENTAFSSQEFGETFHRLCV